MTEEKSKRINVALTIGAVILLIILIFVMLYQIIAISNTNKKNQELNDAIAEYDRLIAEGEEIKEGRSNSSWIILRAYELGYYFEDDIPLGK